MTIAVISMIRDAWGGSEELWYHMAKEALQNGHQVVHLSYEHPVTHPKMAELVRLGLIRVTRPGWVPATSPTGKLIHVGWNYLRKKAADPIKKLLSYQPDIIVYNGTCYSIAAEKGLLHYLEQTKYKAVPFYIIGQLNTELVRDITDAQANTILKAYQRSKKVFFVSERNKQTAQRHLCATIENTEVIRNPVNISATDAIPFPPVDQTIQFAMVANLVTVHKGQDLMLQALQQWPQKDWKLNIYGSGYDAAYLQQLTTYLNLQDQVTFHGTTQNIRDVWQQNHVLLLPSHMEGMPLVVVEAMLCGRVCLATNVGGVAEWITDGETGFLAEAPTINALMKTLEKAWRKKEEWPQIAQAAHQTALKLYDPEAGKNLLRRIIAQ